MSLNEYSIGEIEEMFEESVVVNIDSGLKECFEWTSEVIIPISLGFSMIQESYILLAEPKEGETTKTFVISLWCKKQDVSRLITMVNSAILGKDYIWKIVKNHIQPRGSKINKRHFIHLNASVILVEIVALTKK